MSYLGLSARGAAGVSYLGLSASASREELEAAIQLRREPIVVWRGIVRCDVLGAAQDPDRFGVIVNLRYRRARAVYVHRVTVSAARIVSRQQVGERLLAAVDEGFHLLMLGKLRRAGIDSGEPRIVHPEAERW